jgi:hypothetical protein
LCWVDPTYVASHTGSPKYLVTPITAGAARTLECDAIHASAVRTRPVEVWL